MTSWEFEPDQPEDKQSRDPEKDAMDYVMTYGKYKTKTFGEIMRTQAGRQYLKWLSQQDDADQEWAQAREKRNARIDTCFTVYARWRELHSLGE